MVCAEMLAECAVVQMACDTELMASEVVLLVYAKVLKAVTAHAH